LATCGLPPLSSILSPQIACFSPAPTGAIISDRLRPPQLILGESLCCEKPSIYARAMLKKEKRTAKKTRAVRIRTSLESGGIAFRVWGFYYFLDLTWMIGREIACSMATRKLQTSIELNRCNVAILLDMKGFRGSGVEGFGMYFIFDDWPRYGTPL
jgi:hypothetical protein